MRFPVTALLALVFLASGVGCTSMRTAAPTSGETVTRLKIRPGDTVRILTKYRQSHTFKVTALDAVAMSGETVKLSRKDPGSEHEAVKVRYADMALIEVKRHSAARTAMAGLVVVEVVGLVVLATNPPIGIVEP